MLRARTLFSLVGGFAPGRLRLVQTPEETKVRRPKVYYRVELAEGILGGAARDPLTS
jgi:hypothetical protein